MVSPQKVAKYAIVGGMAIGGGSALVWAASDMIGGTTGESIKNFQRSNPKAVDLMVAGGTLLLIPKVLGAI